MASKIKIFIYFLKDTAYIFRLLKHRFATAMWDNNVNNIS